MNREEAIEVYRGLINTKIKEAFEFFAPELREINEEEIRKDLIGGLMWQRDNLKSEGPHDNNLILPGFCLTVGKHIAYLEKQKEQKEIPLMNGDADLYFDEWNQQHSNPTKRECFEAGMLYAVRLLTEDSPMLEEFKKGLEQVILWGREGYKVSSDGNIKLQTQDEIDEVLDEQKEQKPMNLLDIMFSKDPHLPKQAVKYEQKPTEWSEEDEECIKTIEIELGKSKTVSHDSYLRTMDFLRFLRPQKKEDLAKMLQDEYEKGREYGEREGHTKGFNKGYTEGYKAGQESMLVKHNDNQLVWCDGTHCINPHHDCVNCPTRYSSSGTITTTNSATIVDLPKEDEK